jgi:hypothetical protein
LRDDLQAQRGLAGRFRAINLDDAAARQAADAQRDVEAQRACGNDRQVAGDLGIAHFHYRTLAELLFDLLQRRREGFAFVVVHAGSPGVEGHDDCPLLRIRDDGCAPRTERPFYTVARLCYGTIVRCNVPGRPNPLGLLRWADSVYKSL